MTTINADRGVARRTHASLVRLLMSHSSEAHAPPFTNEIDLVESGRSALCEQDCLASCGRHACWSVRTCLVDVVFGECHEATHAPVWVYFHATHYCLRETHLRHGDLPESYVLEEGFVPFYAISLFSIIGGNTNRWITPILTTRSHLRK